MSDPLASPSLAPRPGPPLPDAPPPGTPPDAPRPDAALAVPTEGSLFRRGFRRMLAFVRRASDRVFAALVVALLAVVYVVVLPWFALARRLSGPPPTGWQPRGDRDVFSRERLRRMF